MAEWVLADDLAEAIKEYLGADGISRQGYNTEEVSSYSRLAAESGVLPRRLYSILRGECRYVTLSTADKILTAIDRGYLLSNGTIEVVAGSGARPPLDRKAEVG